MSETIDKLKLWCKTNPLGCIGIIVVLIVVILVVINKWAEIKVALTKKDTSTPERFEPTAPSVLAEASVADAVARHAQDHAKDRHGMTIRDYEMEAAYLKGLTT